MIQVHNTRIFYNKIFFISIFLSIIIIINVLFFYDIYSSYELSFYFIDKVHTLPSNITSILKIVYTISISVTWCFILNNIFNRFIKNTITKKAVQSDNYCNSTNKLIIGKNLLDDSIISIPEKGLYQNILITRNYWHWKNIVSNVSIH